jgi:hypothetical protein
LVILLSRVAPQRVVYESYNTHYADHVQSQNGIIRIIFMLLLLIGFIAIWFGFGFGWATGYACRD